VTRSDAVVRALKLLDLADSTTSDNEAVVAFREARKVMIEHQLAYADLVRPGETPTPKRKIRPIKKRFYRLHPQPRRRR
jgi:hypothetical protein